MRKCKEMCTYRCCGRGRVDLRKEYCLACTDRYLHCPHRDFRIFLLFRDLRRCDDHLGEPGVKNGPGPTKKA